MKVILLKDVAKLGRRFETKEVPSGHALNLLIPKGLAISATGDAIKRIEVMKKQADSERKIREDLIAKNIKDLTDVTVTISGKANEKGHLFAGLHNDAIVAELQKQTELQIDPSFIELAQPIKEVGEHMIEVRAGGKSAKFKLIVTAA